MRFNSLLQLGHTNVSFGVSSVVGIAGSGLSCFNVSFGASSSAGIAGSGLSHFNVSSLVTFGWGLGRERMMATA